MDSIKSTNLFLEYNIGIKKENNILYNHERNVVESIDEGFEKINDFKIYEIWKDIYKENKKCNILKTILTIILPKIFTNSSYSLSDFFITGPKIKSMIESDNIFPIKKELYIYVLKYL